ncbi:hypothetical protein AAKU67_003498 [Oxalobacteraceae bacterium GrIS 2.11]
MITEHKAPQKGMSHSSRIVILQSLIPIATSLTATQLEGFTLRLGEALFKLSDQSVRPEEANISFHSYNHLKKNSGAFYRLASGKLSELFAYEVRLLEKGHKPRALEDDSSLALVTFDEMENKVLLETLSQSIELDNADELVKLNLRISHLLKIDQINVKYNPFRPEVFLKAIYKAWCEFEPVADSHHLVLRILKPETFLQLNPILRELNNALIERGILPKASDLFKLNKHQGSAASNNSTLSRKTAVDPFFESKIKGILFANQDPGAGTQQISKEAVTAADPNFHVNEATNVVMDHQGTVTIDRQFFEYLTGIQGKAIPIDPRTSNAATLRGIVEQAPQNTITQIDSNTIGLLAKIFDYVFSDPHIPADLKSLIGQLQIPTLKAALIDREFFFKQTHPARVLIDTLAKSSVTWNPDKGVDDPLYKMIARTVERVQKEFDQQLELFSDVAADLAQFLEEEEKQSQKEIEEPIAQAMQQEKIRQARELATNDVATRTDSGEVAGFIESFLEQQWVNILVLAHTVKEQKPQALERTLKTMDDLIWSVKPKNSVEERHELVNKLPALLSSLNTWLNAIKWEDPSRVIFFSKLAERHASIARAPMEVSTRRQVEIAVNVAQKASEKSLKKSKNDQTMPDQFVFFIDQIEKGSWFDFTRNNGSVVRFKLAWVSPRRSRFIFTNRQGHDAFSISSEELIDIFRSGKALMINDEPVIDRALQAVVEERN